jgi:hypothetical protein
MRGTLISAIAASLLAVAFFGAKPAAAAPSPAALNYGEHQAGVVQEVGRKYRYGRKWYRHRPYAYRYRPYGYYYRPYAYYGGPGYYWGYPYYYRRPGVSFWFGF